MKPMTIEEVRAYLKPALENDLEFQVRVSDVFERNGGNAPDFWIDLIQEDWNSW